MEELCKLLTDVTGSLMRVRDRIDCSNQIGTVALPCPRITYSNVRQAWGSRSIWTNYDVTQRSSSKFIVAHCFIQEE
jgi:hypothetical protein